MRSVLFTAPSEGFKSPQSRQPLSYLGSVIDGLLWVNVSQSESVVQGPVRAEAVWKLCFFFHFCAAHENWR